MRTFTPTEDFKDGLNQYLAGLNYNLRDNNPQLVEKAQLWESQGKIRFDSITRTVRARPARLQGRATAKEKS